ncbi:type I restriction-modification system subunit S (plasmid) [Mesomycoplasma conjunctivae]|nr:type I restriction-modification system subunit S [Mycoplasmopsis fermentans]VEU61230.1 type I restriction-modification system subunit S [Mycoplasmopsis fermentans]VEU66982.1 type I restriction-modification system subunit S [Mesomycoplasma conjunctivae]
MLVKLKDIVTFINGRAYSQPELQDKGKYRIVRVGNFSGKNEWFYSDMELNEDKYCENGDLLYKWACNFGPEIWKSEKTIFHYHIWKIKWDEKRVDKMFLYYLLMYMTPYWLSSTNGSIMIHITKETMEEKIVDLPPLKTQKKISKILENLDKQIEKNLHIVKRLQVMGQAIFNRWFLQFEHFKKDNKFKYNEDLNLKIPENWEVKKIAEICKIFLGGTPSTKNREYWNGEINWLNSGEVANFPIIDSEKTINEKGLKNSNTKLLKKGTVVISITGNIRVSYLAIDSCINQSIVGIEENELLKIGYLYPFLKNKIEFLIRSSTGNCQKHINKNFIENLKIVLPPKNVLDIFNNLTQNIYAKISQISLMTKKLIKFKNKLLPLLINQQII